MDPQTDTREGIYNAFRQHFAACDARKRPAALSQREVLAIYKRAWRDYLREAYG